MIDPPGEWGTPEAPIPSGPVVDGSLPIRTEKRARQHSMSSVAPPFSGCRVHRKHSSARQVRTGVVIGEMHGKLLRNQHGLRDIDLRGPHFVHSSVSPDLESLSGHRVPKKDDEPAAPMTVSGFQRKSLGMAVDFVIADRIPIGDGDAEGIDDMSILTLLHQGDPGQNEAPPGTCMTHAPLRRLSDRDPVSCSAGTAPPDHKPFDEPETDRIGDREVEGASAGMGGEVRMESRLRRKISWIGHEDSGGRSAPLIDLEHQLVRLRRTVRKVGGSSSIGGNGFARHAVLVRQSQGLIELAASEVRAILASISTHIAVCAGVASLRPPVPGSEIPI